MFTESAQAVIDRAKDWAHTHGRGVLDVDALLAALGDHPEGSARLAQCMGLGDMEAFRAAVPAYGQTGRCPGKLDLSPEFRSLLGVALELAGADGVPDRSHPGLVHVAHLCCALAMSGAACACMPGEVRPIDRAEAARLLASWAQNEGGIAELAGLLDRLRRLRGLLRESVFGQDHAIHTFVEGLYNAELTAHADAARKRPVAVFVFAGPPGVGKTYVAELASTILERPFRRFDMTGYTDHQSHNQLVGFSPSFQNAHEGLLTGFVQQNPSAILLFDEVEKAHLNVLQFFYQILDAGHLEDKFSERDVDFRDTIIIFTTNAGRALYDSAGSGPGAARMAVHKQTILSALGSEKNPTDGNPAFPPAICSRLAQGYPVLFNHLGICELELVCQHSLRRVERLLEQHYFKQFAHDDKIPLALVLREGGQADARRVAASAERFVKEQLFYYASLYEAGRLEEALGPVRQIRLCVESGLPAEVEALFAAKEPPTVLMVANTPHFDLCQRRVPGVVWKHAASAGEAAECLSANDVSLVLVDMWLDASLEQVRAGGDPDAGGALRTYSLQHDFVPLSSSSLKAGREVLQITRERFPAVPVYVLSFTDNGDGEDDSDGTPTRAVGGAGDSTWNSAPPRDGQPRRRPVDDELLLACIRSGGVRGLVPTGFVDDFRPDWEERLARFQASLSAILTKLHRETQARRLAKERKFLDFETSPRQEAGAPVLSILARNFRIRRSLDAMDVNDVLQDVDRPTTRLDDVFGAAGAKEALQFIVRWLGNPKHFQGLGIRPPRGALLAGPPGTGKTMLARALAGEADCAFLETSATSFVTMWQGSGPQNIRDLFARARRYAPAIIFIDEIDAIGRQRSGGPSSRAQEETLNALLTEMDGFKGAAAAPVVVLAATNLVDLLDEALKRRFDRVIEVDPPDRDARLAYLRRCVEQRKRADVPEETLARLAGQSAGMTIADLERVVQEAGVLAVQGGRPLDGALLEEAFEKVRMGEKKAVPDAETLLRVARHEAGHTLVACMGGALPVQVTIIGRGGAGGYMEREADEGRLLYTKGQLEQRIREAMAGRAAELMYYGDEGGLSTGVGSDLEHATHWALRMAREFGMTDALGQVALERLTGKLPAEGELALLLAKEARRIVEDELRKAGDLLLAHREKLDALARALLAKNRLTAPEIREIVGDMSR